MLAKLFPFIIMMKHFSIRSFRIATGVFEILMILSLNAAWGQDEGTLGNGFVGLAFAKLLYILRFPTHTLLCALIIKGGAWTFLGGLFSNCLFYGFVTE